jgi:hypothetical protein
LDAIAVRHHDPDEDVFERAATVGHRSALAVRTHPTVAVPREDPYRLAVHVGCQVALRPQRLDPFVAGKDAESELAMVAQQPGGTLHDG